MPGHVDGITCLVSLSMGSLSPMTYKNLDWSGVEAAVRSLKGHQFGSGANAHVIKEVNVVLMTPSASTLSKHWHPIKGTKAAQATAGGAKSGTATKGSAKARAGKKGRKK